VIRVTIVGAGHYARSIVSRKYAECPLASLHGVISPRSPTERLLGTPLERLPLSRSAADWLRLNGAPDDRDLFDLCVHPDSILPALRPLVDAGARLFVLPKPLATTRAGLDEVVEFIRRAGLRVAVASQWHYSRVTGTLRETAATLRRPLQVEMDFSQRFDAVQRDHYTPYTALLPHMLQVLHTAGLWRLDESSAIVRHESKTHVRAEISSPAQGVTIALHTDIDAAVRRRSVTILDSAGRRVIADFLGVFQDGIAEKYPAVEVDGHRKEIVEDNIAVMVRQEITGFLEGAAYLEIDGYLPVNNSLVALHG
jgi:predicted dehydrogenase